jgi:hypothetical protein
MQLLYTKDARAEHTHCKFCGRNEAQAGVLVVGDEAAICPQCISTANHTLLENSGIRYLLTDEFQTITKKSRYFAVFVLLFFAVLSMVSIFVILKVGT